MESSGGVTESELHRLGRRVAVFVRTAVLVCACGAALFQVQPDQRMPAAVAIGALGLWTAVYVRSSSRAWLLPADTLVIVALCLAQQWIVPPDSLSDSTNWVLAVVSITVVAHQWFTTTTGAVLLTTTITAAHLTGVLLAAPQIWTETVPIGLWTFAEAALSRVLFLLVRAGARRADETVAASEAARRDAAVAAARRADEREHLAVLHDTAAATLLAVGSRMVDGTEPWLARQAARDLEALAAQGKPPTRTQSTPVSAALNAPTTPAAHRGEPPATQPPPDPGGVPPCQSTGWYRQSGGSEGQLWTTGPAVDNSADLVRVLDEVVRGAPVTVEVQAPDAVPVPATPAAAIGAAAREALANVARHAGVDTAELTITQTDDAVTVDITDHGTGFRPGHVSPHRRGVANSIRERMTRAGGRATIITRPGEGTRIRLEWPHD